jgi:hypothetical protein
LRNGYKFAVLIVKLCLPSKKINCESQGLLKHLLFTRFLNDLHAMRLTSMLISPSIPPLARAEGGFRSRGKSESALTLFLLSYTEATCIKSEHSAPYIISVRFIAILLFTAAGVYFAALSHFAVRTPRCLY